MKFDTNTPRSSVTIAGTSFSVPTPFAAGYTLNENEASALNQVLIENIRNNMAARVKEGTAEGGTPVTQDEVDSYVASYEFGVRRGGGGSSDPIQKEAMDIAKQLVRVNLQKQGHKLADIPSAKITELAKSVLDGPHGDAIRKRAAKVVKEREALGNEEITLSL